MDFILQIAHYGFLIFHTALILFNLLGWIWQKTRRLNLILLILTGVSWFVLGIFFGIGYCPCTDWHWQVLYELGRYPETYSYMVYLIKQLFDLELGRQVVDAGTVIGYFLALILSIIFNMKDKAKDGK